MFNLVEVYIDHPCAGKNGAPASLFLQMLLRIKPPSRSGASKDITRSGLSSKENNTTILQNYDITCLRILLNGEQYGDTMNITIMEDRMIQCDFTTGFDADACSGL